MFNATLNSISVLLMEENSENHQPVTHHWQTLLHNIVSSTHHHKWEFELTTSVVLGTDCTVSCKSNYHMIMTTTAPLFHVYHLTGWNNNENMWENIN